MAPEPRRAARWRAWAVEIALLVLVYVAVSSWRERELLPTGADPAPAFTLADLDGKRVDLQSLRGDQVMLQFWATWCGVCRQEFGAMNWVARHLGPRQRVFAIVEDSDDPARVRRFVKDNSIEYPVLLGTAAVLRAYHVSVFPTTYFIGADGRVRGRTTGMSTRWGLATRLGCAR